jgi:hypothetical protein
MRVALVHDWLTGMRGGEAVLAEIASFFPGAPPRGMTCSRVPLAPNSRSRSCAVASEATSRRRARRTAALIAQRA